MTNFINKIEKYKPNDYEIEFKITNKYKFIKNIQQFLHVDKFEKTKIYYFNSDSSKKSKSTQKIRILENMENHKEICEQKDVLIKDKIKLNYYPYEIQIKVSKESEIKQNEIQKNKANSICYRYRLIFSCVEFKDFPFEIDLSMRVFPKNNKDNLPAFTDEDVFNPTYNSSDDYSVVYDLEFEILKDYKGTIESAFKQLEKLLMKTNEEYVGKLDSTSNSKLKITGKDSNSDSDSDSDLNSTLKLTGKDLNSDSDSDSDLNSTLKLTGKDSNSDSDFKLNELIESTFDFRKTPQVNVLTNKIIDTIDLSNFVYLEKTDGLRTLLIFDSNVLYSYRIKEGLSVISDSILNSNLKFVVDSELFEDKYYVFDVYYINQDIRELPFIERMNKFKKFLENSNSINNIIKLKTYSEIDINKLSELINYGMTKRPNVDGIVFQSKEGYSLDEWLKKDYQYKLKPLELTTTDFLYKWIESEQCYYLYLIGTFGELLFNLRARPRCLQKAYTPLNIDLKNIEKRSDGYLILFDTPLFENMYKCEIDIEDIKRIENLNSEIDLNKKGCLDGLIIETSYFMENRKYQQTPIRIRWDKVNPNGYRIGFANACILFSPPTAENHYFHKITNEDIAKTFKLGEPLNEKGESLINTFHVINQKIRDYTFEVLKDYLKSQESKTKTAFDLCGGRGSDLKRLYSLGFNNIIAADADVEALTTYAIKGIFYRSWNLNFGKLSLNCIHEPLGNDGKELNLILKMKQRYEFKKSDLIVIDYALHYICDFNFEKNLKNLMKIIKNVSNPGAYILINFYDGDKIIKNDGNFKIFKIKITKNNYTDEIKAFMPLPTIEKNGYREEPLLLNKHIELLKNEGMNILKDYYPVEENDFVNDLEDIEMGVNMIDYLKCIRSIIGRVY
jgi:hypothetical protein